MISYVVAYGITFLTRDTLLRSTISENQFIGCEKTRRIEE
jgi:hypothetical protein